MLRISILPHIQLLNFEQCSLWLSLSLQTIHHFLSCINLILFNPWNFFLFLHVHHLNISSLVSSNWVDSMSSPPTDSRVQATGVLFPHAPTAPPDLVTATYWSMNHHMRWDSIVFEGTTTDILYVNENYLHVLNIMKVGVTGTHQRMLCGVTCTPAEFIPVQTDFNSTLEDCHG